VACAFVPARCLDQVTILVVTTGLFLLFD